MFPWARQIYDSHKAAPANDESRRICELMASAQHVEVDFAIWDYASELAVEHSLSNKGAQGGASAPDGGRLFSDSLVVTVNLDGGPEGRSGTVCKLFTRANVGVACFLLMPYGRHLPNGKSFALASGYRPGQTGFARSELMDFGADQETTIQEALQDAFLISVLGHDRFVRREAGASRQQRRSVERAIGFAPAGWYRVTWNIGEDVKAKVAASDPDSARPLHFCRAHWRQAVEGQPKAIARNDAPGWWCWVRECWKGHPAFGVKLHHYTPKLRQEGSMNLRAKSKTVDPVK